MAAPQPPSIKERSDGLRPRDNAEGPDVSGRRLLVVEDVITSGGQVVLSTADLRERGAIVSNVVCVINRGQGGNEALAEIGLSMRALFQRSDLEG